MSKDKDKKKENVALQFSVVAIVVFALWLFSWWWIDDKYSVLHRGSFGDKFGAVNALFSGLAFAGILVALRLQSKELKDTREVLKDQKVQLENQYLVLEKQKFEHSFFQLLNLLQQLVNSMDTNYGSTVFKGKDCFERFYDKMMIDVRAPLIKEIIINEYEKFFIGSQQDLGYYFRTLYQIIKSVDKSTVDNKKFYTNIVRAQLSNYELVLLFYNCLSKHGSEKFLPLVKTYKILKHLPEDLVPINHRKLFKETAF